jgi:hypothetical protein
LSKLPSNIIYIYCILKCVCVQSLCIHISSCLYIYSISCHAFSMISPWALAVMQALASQSVPLIGSSSTPQWHESTEPRMKPTRPGLLPTPQIQLQGKMAWKLER